MTLSSIVSKARDAFGEQFELRYLHPTLYLVCKDDAFSNLDDAQRMASFRERTGLPPDITSTPGLGSALSVVLATTEERKRQYDFLDASSPGEHWLPLLDPTTLASQPVGNSKSPRAIHFYGYKGGQARSTVLAMLAKQLADDNYRVLVVDADVEAPSLDILFSVAASNPEQTLLGLVAPQGQIEPLSAYRAAASAGRVDLLACRPSSADYDMDFAAFILRTALDVTALEDGFKRLLEYVQPSAEKGYDVLLIDHRSGMAPSVLPVIRAYPGPVVICLRTDEQSTGAGSLFHILLRQVADTPGAYVSFSLDPEDTRDKVLGNHGARISELLETLGAAVERGAAKGEQSDHDLPPEDFLRYWVSWFHDRAFLGEKLPLLSEIAESNRRSLLQLREVLGFSGCREDAVRVRTRPVVPAAGLSPSGASDEGIFIETQEIARLFQPNTAITYIFGRKGTGKTRILRELQVRNLGEPLVVAADAKEGGLASGDTLFTDLVNTFRKDPEKLWWIVLAAALSSTNTITTEFQEQLRKWEKKASEGNNFRVSDIAALAALVPNRRVLLIDGVETAFLPSQLTQFVKALFKFLLTVQSDSQFSNRVIIRLFLRTDLARGAIQNVEQQTSGRRLDLTWNTQSIFNFVLSRIAQITWFRANFEDTCVAIDSEQDRVRAGLLTEEQYEPLLLEVFPRHLRRNNMQTLTFLKTYFSDAAGEDDARAAFYPRLFDAFLRFISNPQELGHRIAPREPIEDGRVNQSLVLAAHEAASRKFLDEVKQELSVLLDLAPESVDNEKRVSDLLAAFEGLPTPFELDACLRKLEERVHNANPQSLRESLHRMKEVGMFEERPGWSGWWRAGRLFKSALRMKYVRK